VLAVAETTHVTGHPGALAHASNALATGSDLHGAAAGAAPAEAGLPEGALTSAELAKLFASMQARDAAKVLEQMDDFEVQVILGALGNREAAAILSNLSPERAAVISRAVIRGERSGR
jgi:Mg/Co/Ni transporter MgtE